MVAESESCFDMPSFYGGDTIDCGSDGHYVHIYARRGERSQFASAYRLTRSGDSTCVDPWISEEAAWLRGESDRPPDSLPPPAFMRVYLRALAFTAPGAVSVSEEEGPELLRRSDMRRDLEREVLGSMP